MARPMEEPMHDRVLYRLTWLALAMSLGHHLDHLIRGNGLVDGVRRAGRSRHPGDHRLAAPARPPQLPWPAGAIWTAAYHALGRRLLPIMAARWVFNAGTAAALALGLVA
jgi:hypothetical protein